jgi:hypothetical protein
MTFNIYANVSWLNMHGIPRFLLNADNGHAGVINKFVHLLHYTVIRLSDRYLGDC